MNATASAAHAAKRKRRLWLLTVIGFFAPTIGFGKLFADNGFGKESTIRLAKETVSTLPATVILADAALAANTFLTWAKWDARQNNVPGWWAAAAGTYLVGICFGAPLYLLLREYAIGAQTATAAARTAEPAPLRT